MIWAPPATRPPNSRYSICQKRTFQDKLFIAALLAEPAYIRLTDSEHINELVKPEDWHYTPAGGVGICQHSIDINELIGQVGSTKTEAQALPPPQPLYEQWVPRAVDTDQARGCV